MSTTLLLDAPYLAYRSFYTTGGLSFNGDSTGVTFGFLRALLDLQDRFQTEKVVFCFDDPPYKRKEIYPQYKFKEERPEKEEIAIQGVRWEIGELKYNHLRELGYKNILFAGGYEADDCLASLVQGRDRVHSRTRQQYIVVSADHDLYQLLRPNVQLYNPAAKRLYTADDLYRDFGITPEQWAQTKALAGCTSDNIQGIPGVGEITASRFLGGRLAEKSLVYAKILAHEAVWQRNLKLTKLPFPGTPDFKLKVDRVTKRKWRALCKKLGTISLIDRLPLGASNYGP